MFVSVKNEYNEKVEKTLDVIIIQKFIHFIIFLISYIVFPQLLKNNILYTNF